MKTFQPKILSLFKNYNGKKFTSDLVAGIIVAIIALPLSIALAIASGVEPERGLYTAIVAGFVIALLGGSNVNISGPTAAFATIVAGVVANFGFSGLVVATVMAGIMLILMGVCRLGSLIKFIPKTITTGFTAGIAVTIAIGQVKDFLGLTYPAGTHNIETIEKIENVAANIGTLNVWGILIGALSLAILIVWPKISKKIPGSLIAVIVGTAVVKLLDLEVTTIGDLYTISNNAPAFSVPAFDFGMIKQLFPSAFTIAILAAIESLLSCVVSDGMISDKHNSNTELIALGAGNVCSGLFGGIPATGAIARTAANVKNGGRTPVAGIIHAVLLLLILVVLMPYAAWIPMPVIASVLFMVAYNMSEWRHFVEILKTAPLSDIIVLILTFVLTVVFDLVVAIEVGLALTFILFVLNITGNVTVRRWHEKGECDEKEIPPHTEVYEFEGPMFFASSDVLSDILPDESTKNVIIRMRNVQTLDISGFYALEKLCMGFEKKGIRVILSHTNSQPMEIIKKAGLYEKLGENNFAENITSALKILEE